MRRVLRGLNRNYCFLLCDLLNRSAKTETKTFSDDKCKMYMYTSTEAPSCSLGLSFLSVRLQTSNWCCHLDHALIFLHHDFALFANTADLNFFFLKVCVFIVGEHDTKAKVRDLFRTSLTTDGRTTYFWPEMKVGFSTSRFLTQNFSDQIGRRSNALRID